MSKRLEVDGFVLKMIAVCTMLIDHTAAAVVQTIAQAQGYRHLYILEFGNKFQVTYTIMRSIGRMAFPIYCMLLVEGFIHTHSKKKYCMNLLLFALLSEIPFDRALYENWVDLSHCNVFFTLALGLIGMLIFEYIENNISNAVLKNVGYILVALAVGFIAKLLKTDYDLSGIFAILIMYEYRRTRVRGYVLAVVVLGLFSKVEFFALLMLPLVYLYNGKRGYNSKGLKYFFYAFYPVHLSILTLINICILKFL